MGLKATGTGIERMSAVTGGRVPEVLDQIGDRKARVAMGPVLTGMAPDQAHPVMVQVHPAMAPAATADLQTIVGVQVTREVMAAPEADMAHPDLRECLEVLVTAQAARAECVATTVTAVLIMDRHPEVECMEAVDMVLQATVPRAMVHKDLKDLKVPEDMVPQVMDHRVFGAVPVE